MREFRWKSEVSHRLKDGNGNGKDTFVWAIMTKLPFPHFKLGVSVKGNSVSKNDVETIKVAEALWLFPRFVGIRLHPISTQATHLWRFLPCLLYNNVGFSFWCFISFSRHSMPKKSWWFSWHQRNNLLVNFSIKHLPFSGSFSGLVKVPSI